MTTLVGIWVFVTPWTLHYIFPESAASGVVAWNHCIVGLAIVVLSAAGLAAYEEEREGWMDVVVGSWLIVSPWVLGFYTMTALTWNAIIMGAITVILSEVNFYEMDTP